ncbi:DNA ligase [Candidatus Persebacteraceae bacterium Df01]|jgi:DNA ligase-1|uniref:DNA ligase n=1 Tax=Candidatus Doriopsillibacter californiensis TaxID=2970740 RepID=A0ABT7QKC1_9GAMM|nr:DNA ligase [Candidatus Persebacteraceae bacterium Df01]
MNRVFFRQARYRIGNVIRQLFCIFVVLLVLPVAAGEPVDLLLANNYRDDINLSDYYVSEKLDGVRAYWDGKKLISRKGNVFTAPTWFVKNFPDAPLDGELWSGRGQFDFISGTVRRVQPHDGWSEIGYMVFDMPEAGGDFSNRLQLLQETVTVANTPYLKVVKQIEVADKKTLMQRMKQVVNTGGEGLMLRRKDSLYRGGRSNDLLKLKLFNDAEAVVIAHHPGKGKFLGMLGSLGLQMPNGTTFHVGTGFSNEQRLSPPPVGAVVTYKYQGLTNNGKPRFPVFLRVRKDEPPSTKP